MYRNVKLAILFGIAMLFIPSFASASVIFNQNYSITDIVSYNGAYSALSTSTFDFFQDDAAAGNITYFGWEKSVFQGIYFNVSTPLSATSINIAWEFYNESSSAWEAFPDLVDNTNNFTTAGRNSVEWSVPNNWGPTANLGGIAAADSLFARARITSVSGLTEGGANTGFTALVKDYTIRVIGAGNRLSDIKAANDAGSWGVVHQYGGDSGRIYILDSNLRIGSGSNSEFILTNNEILQLGAEDKTRIFMSLRNGNTFTMGNKSTRAYGTDYNNGAIFYYYNSPICWPSVYNSWYGKLEMYGSKWWKRGGNFCDPALYQHSSTNSIMKFSTLESKDFLWYMQAGSTMNITDSYIVSSWNYYIYIYSGSILIDGLSILQGRGTLTTKAVTYQNIDYGAAKQHSVSGSVTATLKNCNFDTGFFTQVITTYANRIAKEVYTLDFVFLDEAGDTVTNVNVTIVDAQTQELYNAEWSGELDVEVRRENGAAQTEYNPLHLTITKENYQDIDFYYNLTEKKTLVGVFNDYPFVVDGTIVISQPENSVIVKRCE